MKPLFKDLWHSFTFTSFTSREKDVNEKWTLSIGYTVFVFQNAKAPCFLILSQALPQEGSLYITSLALG